MKHVLGCFSKWHAMTIYYCTCLVWLKYETATRPTVVVLSLTVVVANGYDCLVLLWALNYYYTL